jgi:hypothetical protein
MKQIGVSPLPLLVAAIFSFSLNAHCATATPTALASLKASPACTEPSPQSTASLTATDVKAKGMVPLPVVVNLVEQALKCYQLVAATSAGGSSALQPLKSVNFDFKATTSKTVGFSLNILVLKIGASSEKDVTDDISFTYSVPPLPSGGTHNLVKPTPPTLYDELVKDVQAAATAASGQSTALGKPLSEIDVTVSYGLKFDANAGVSVPIQLVTIGGNGDYNKNNVQTVKLTFAPKAKLPHVKAPGPNATKPPAP